MKLLFVYGTLKRGASNHQWLAGQTFIGEARTQPGYRLYDVGGYPAMVLQPGGSEGVWGEVWSVAAGALQQLDEFEGIAEGLYRREPVPLLPPFAEQTIEAYVYPHSIVGRAEVGSVWYG